MEWLKWHMPAAAGAAGLRYQRSKKMTQWHWAAAAGAAGGVGKQPIWGGE